MGKTIYITRQPNSDEVTLVMDTEGALYIAEVMETYQPKDAGAREIARAILENVGSEDF